MKALAKTERREGIWLVRDAPEPEVGVHDVLIRIRKSAICGTDVHIYNWDEWSQRTIPVPMIVGHEYVGVVERVGAEVEAFTPGDRVSGEGHLTCGFCRNCRAGRRHLCRHTVGVGVNRPGSFAELLSIPSVNVYKIPDDVPDDIAAIFDPYGNAVHTALSFDLVGEDVLVTGAGPIGAMAAAVARHVGLKVVMADLGMKEGFDVGLEMSGNGGAFRQLLDVMNHGGKVALLGIMAGQEAIDWSQVVFKGLILKGIYGREMFETWYKMVAMLQTGLHLSPVVTHRFPIERFQEGFEVMRSGRSGKVILDWDAVP